jgi:hypothetical protein
MRSNSAPSGLLGLVFAAAVLYGLYYVLRSGVGLFAGIGPEVTAVTAAAALTLLLSASIVANGLHAIARREDLRQERAMRAIVYEQLVRLRASTESRGEPHESERHILLANAATAHQQMLLHGSPEVLKAYLRLRHAEEAGATTGAEREEMVQLVRAIRRDLGHRSPDVGMAELTEMLRSPDREPV